MKLMSVNSKFYETYTSTVNFSIFKLHTILCGDKNPFLIKPFSFLSFFKKEGLLHDCHIKT